MKQNFCLIAFCLCSAAKAHAAPLNSPEFRDVPRGHWAYESVRIAAQIGTVEGFADNTFRGNQSLTRFECAMFAARFLERLPIPEWERERRAVSRQSAPLYKDIPPTHWSFHALESTQLRTIAPIFQQPNFAGNTPILRYEGAAVLLHLLSIMAQEKTPPDLTKSIAELHAGKSQYPDVDINHWAASAVQCSSERGYLEGLPNGNFGGALPMTRYQFVNALSRINICRFVQDFR